MYVQAYQALENSAGRAGLKLEVEMKKINRILVKCRYALLFIILLGLCSLFPYTGDDWAWGSSIGIERLQSWFDNYNGRYVGNLIVLALTRSTLLRNSFMAFCLTGIVFCMEKIVGKRWAFAAGGFLLIAMPKAVLRQAVVWTAGFSNYTTSVFFVLIYIAYVCWIFNPKEQAQSHLRQKPVHGLLFFLLGAISSLIVEHITIYNVVLGLGVLVYVYIKYKKVLVQHICYSAGGILGALYMFSNTAYHSIAKQEDTYRTVAFSGVLSRAKENYINEMYSGMFMQNLWLNALIVLVCIALYFGLRDKIKNKGVSGVLFGCLCGISAYFVWCVFSTVYLAYDTKPVKLLHIEAWGTFAAAVCLIVFSVIIAVIRKNPGKQLLFIGSVLCIAAPLLVVTPIGSRCFLATYVFLALLFMELLKMLLELHGEKKTLVKAVRLFCLLGCCFGLVFYAYIYGSIHKVDVSRLEHIREEVSKGETTVELIRYPYESFLWCATPGTSTDIWAARYKLFYDIPEEIELIPVHTYSH